MVNLTQTQQDILEYINRSVQDRGFPPTLREICSKFQFSSTNGARYHVLRLQKLGFLEVLPKTSRGVKPISKSSPKNSSRFNYLLPILGRVPAGPLDLAAQDIYEDEVSVDPQFFGSREPEPELFGLKVKGDSMINEGIYDGDVVVVRPQQTASDGSIVVARVEEEATVKRFRRTPNEILLEAANPAYKPIRVQDLGGDENGQSVGILGIVVGLIRAM